jgi:hypothetical protein
MVSLDGGKRSDNEQLCEPVSWEKILGAVSRGWCHEENANKTMDIELAMAIVKEVKALYVMLPQRKPLTDEQREEISKGWRGRNWTVGDIIDAIEAAHGIKELNI